MFGFEVFRHHDLRLAGPAITAWVSAWLVTGEWRNWAIGAGGVALICLLVGWYRRVWVISVIGLAMIGSLLAASLHLSILRQGLLAQLGAEREVAEVVVAITSETRIYDANGPGGPQGTTPVSVVRVDARGESYSLYAHALLVANEAQIDQVRDLAVGSQIQALVAVTPPHSGEGIAARLRLKSQVTLVSNPAFGHRFVNRLRSGLRQGVSGNADSQAGLVPALVVGDVSTLPKTVVDDFRLTGLSHLTAVSGTNLTLLLAFAFGVLRRFAVKGWWLRLSGLGVIALFVVLCRSEPSVVRAAAMGLVALAATGASSRGGGVRNLLLAVLSLVVLDPWLSRSWGFALSAAASAGILVFGGPWQRRMRCWAPAWIAEAICIPLAAQITTQPLVTALSGSISVAGVLANALAGPFVGPVTILGIVVAILSLISAGIAGLVGFIAGWCVQPIIWIAHLLANLPAASWKWTVTPASMAVLIVLCLGALAVAGSVISRRWATGLLAFMLILGCFYQPPPPGWPGNWRMVVCDVGQGDATVLRAGKEDAMLVDTGPDGQLTVSCLNRLGVRKLPLVIITHAHADHLGGLAEVLNSFEVGTIMSADVSGVERALAAKLRSRPPVVETRSGDQFQVGEVKWTTLGPIGVPAVSIVQGEGESSAENNRSVVGLADISGLRVLVTGDVEPAGQDALVAAGTDLKADVLRIPHHGSARQSSEFFSGTKASVAIASVGLKNDYGHPAVRTLNLARSLGMEVFRTDLGGSVAVEPPEGASIVVRTERRT